MVNIPLKDRLVDLVVDEDSQRFALITRDDKQQSHFYIYGKKGANTWAQTLHQLVPDTIVTMAFVPGQRNRFFRIEYDGYRWMLVLLELTRFSETRGNIRRVWTAGFKGATGPVAVSSQQIAVPVPQTGKLHIFSIDDGKLISAFPMPGAVTALRFSPASRYLAAGCGDGSVYIFDHKGSVHWKGKAHDHVTQVLFNSSTRILAATASGHLSIFTIKPSSDPEIEHQHLVLPLGNITGILELTEGWVVWSKDALVRIRDDLQYAKVSIRGEVRGLINEPRKRPLIVTMDPHHSRMQIELLPGGKGGTPITRPSDNDDPELDTTPGQQSEHDAGHASTRQKETGTTKNQGIKRQSEAAKNTNIPSGRSIPGYDKHKTRCFIMPDRSVRVPNREARLMYHSAALPRSIDAGYDISQGDIGVFYDHGRDALIGPVIARWRSALDSMPDDNERISRGSKYRVAIAVDADAGLSVVHDARGILQSFGLEVVATSSGELYLSKPTLEGRRARELLQRLQQPEAERRSGHIDPQPGMQDESGPAVKENRLVAQPKGGDVRPSIRVKPGDERHSRDWAPSPGEHSDPRLHPPQLQLGIAAYESHQYGAALEAVESAIKQDPQSLVARYIVAEIYLKRGENERAEKQFAAAIPPLGTRVQKEEALVAGFAALRLLDYDRANDIFSKLHAADPKSTTAWYGLQIARDRGQTPDAISYPETTEVAGFPIPLHQIAGIHSYTPVNGPEEIRECYFIMPGHSRTIDTCEESLVFHTPVQRSVDSGYRVAKGDIGYFYDLGRDSLSGPYFAASAPHFAQMPPDHRSERASGHTKNVLAIPLATKGDVRVTGGAKAILESLGFKLMKTHTGELYLPDPVLVGDRAKRFASLVTKKKAREASYCPGEYVAIIDGGFKGQRARVKEIDEEMDKIVVELDGVLLPVPIPLRLKQVSKERR